MSSSIWLSGKCLNPLFCVLLQMSVLLGGVLSVSGCDEIEPIPSYLRIDTAQVQTQVAQGSSLHNIRNVWAYLDGTLLGAFELPAQIPILAQGMHEIRLQAGIWHNGISGERVSYPFYNTPKYTFDFQPASSHQLEPVFEYTDDVHFSFIDDFEAGSVFQPVGGSPELFQTTDIPSEVRSGAQSAKITLQATADTVFQLNTLSYYELPGFNAPVYLEMDYRCDADFQVTLKAINSTGDALTPTIRQYVAARNTWNKIYIDLTEIVSYLNSDGYDRFQIILYAELPNDKSSASYFFDNVKLVN